MSQAKRLKTMENYKTVSPKSSRGRLREMLAYTRGCNYRALTGKILVFWMGGRLWEVVVLGNSTANILKKWSQGDFIGSRLFCLTSYLLLCF